MSEEFSSSTVTDTEFDIVEELKTTVTDLEKEVKSPGNKKISEKFSYLKFLVDVKLRVGDCAGTELLGHGVIPF